MIDAERMLGSLVRNAMRGGGKKRKRPRRRVSSMLGKGAKGGLALGALGVAIGLYEHRSKQQGGATAAGAAGASAPPDPLPPLPTGDRAAAPLPPLPTAAGAATPSAPADESRQEALLLVRAMIAAANADHEVDEEERERILRSLDDAGLGDGERRFVLAEIESPVDLATLASEASSPEVADRVYLASLMAIEVDTRAEENYLARLAERLGLDDERVARLEALLASDPS